jgi:hypothetical protein
MGRGAWLRSFRVARFDSGAFHQIIAEGGAVWISLWVRPLQRDKELAGTCHEPRHGYDERGGVPGWSRGLLSTWRKVNAGA